MRLQSCAAAWGLALLLPCLCQASSLLRGHRRLDASESEASPDWALTTGSVDRIIGTSADNSTVYALNGTAVVAVSLSDGKRLWSTKPAEGIAPLTVHAFPADPSSLWACYAFGSMYKIDTTDGTAKKFKAELLQCTDLFMTPDGQTIVYPYSLIASGFKLLSASNGKVKEDFSLPLLVSDATLTPDGELLIVKGALATEAYAYSVASGEREWTTKLELGEFIGKPFFGSDPSVWYAIDSLSGVLRAFKTADGESVWTSDKMSSLGLTTTPVIKSSADGKTLYLGTDGAGVAVIKAEDGSVQDQWTIKAADIGQDSSSGWFGDLSISSAFRTIDPEAGKVYYADATGSQLVLLDINNGEVLQRITGFGKAKATGFKFSPMTLVSNEPKGKGTKGGEANSFLLLPASWTSPKPGGKLYKIPIIHTTR